MFDPETERATEQRRSRLILMLGAVGALILAGAVVFVTRSQQAPQPQVTTAEGTLLRLENAVRAGAAEFESYKDKVRLENQEPYVSENMLGMLQWTVRATLRNQGDRALTGVELVGKVYHLDGKVVGQNTSVPIPRARPEPLPPGQSLQVIVKIDTPAKVKEDDVKEVKVELLGLRFQ